MAMIIRQEFISNALDVNKDSSKVVTVGRSVFKIYRIDDDNRCFVEELSIRSSKSLLKHSGTDVAWSTCDETAIATAASNGAIVVWNINKSSQCRRLRIYEEHVRSVNRLNFHPFDPSLLISASQDSFMKMFDMRTEFSVLKFASGTEGVRDVQFNPSAYYQFASVCDSGIIQLWDTRRPDKKEVEWRGHSNHIYSCNWHPQFRDSLATGGRDKTINVWDVKNITDVQYTIHAIGPIGMVEWRPHNKDQLVSSCLNVDFAINVWDVRRSFVPLCTFEQYCNATTGIKWRRNAESVVSTSKIGVDGFLNLHLFTEGVKPKMKPVALAINARGNIAQACRDISLVIKTTETKRSSLTEMKDANSSTLVYHSTINKSPEADASVTSVEWIIRAAYGYMLSGKSFSQMCEHNAKLSSNFGMKDISHTWLTLITLYSDVPNDILSLSGNNGETTSETKAPRSRYTSTGGLVVVNDCGDLSSNAVSSHGSAMRLNSNKNFVNKNDEDISENDNYDGIYPGEQQETLTNIATGKMLASNLSGDFFGDDELETFGLDLSAYIDGLGIGSDVGIYVSSTTDELNWNMAVEAFDLQHEIKECSSHINAQSEQFCSNDSQMLSLGDVQSRRQDATDIQNLKVKEEPATLLSVNEVCTDFLQPWSPKAIVGETLFYFADGGDVQTAVCIYMCLGNARRKELDIDTDVLELWFHSYFDLLQKLRLFGPATEMLQSCPLSSINQISKFSTTYLSNCTACKRALSSNSGCWFCARCKSFPNKCAICNISVKGLFVWCQGCGHGGHLNHITKWHLQNKSCATGCGHLCQYK